MEKKKDYYIQVIRGIAIFFVICIHTYSYQITMSKGDYFFAILFRTLFNVAVPIFFFLSGYFFDSEKSNQKEYIKRKIKRVFIPLVIWNVIYFIMNLLLHGWHFDLVLKFVLFKTAPQLYFGVVLILLYLFTPWLLRVDSKIVIGISVLYLVLYRLLWILFHFSIPLHEYIPFAWCIYYLYGLRFKTMKHFPWSIYYTIIIFVVCFLYHYYVFHAIGYRYAISQIHVVNLITSISLIRYLMLEVDHSFIKECFVSKVGDRSFGIYYVHIIFLNIILKIVPANSILRILGIGIVTLFVSYFMIELFSRVTKGKYDKILGLI